MREVSNRRIHGEVPETAHALVAAALTHKEEQMKRKSITLVPITLLIIALLACTALALTITSRSEHYDAIRRGQDALMEEYGFTLETLGLFMESASYEGGEWTVTFKPIKLEAQIGSYTVILPDGGEPVIQAHPLNDVDSGPAQYSPEQIGAILDSDVLYRQEQTRLIEEKGSIWNCTFEELAALDALLAEDSQIALDHGIRIVPGVTDVTPQQAANLVKKRIAVKYGISTDMLDDYTLNVQCKRTAGTDSRYYSVMFALNLQPGQPTDIFSGIVYSPTAEVTGVYWSFYPLRNVLPEGSLADYGAFVREFIEIGAMDALSTEEKADVAARIKKAGLGDLLQGVEYAAPTEGMLAEADALRLAEAALCDTFGFDGPSLALFEGKPLLVTLDGRSAWEITYKAAVESVWNIPFASDRLGEYAVRIDAETREVLACEWSLAEIVKPYTDTTWGAAPAWGVDILPSVAALGEAVAEIRARTQEYAPFSLEDAAEMSQLFRDAGFIGEFCRHGLPDEKDIPLEDALVLLREAVKAEHGLTDAAFDGFRTVPFFYVDDPERHVWHFEMYNTAPGKEDFFRVTIDAGDGEIVMLEYVAQGNG